MADIPMIVFLRHGETDWNREERLQGQRDIPLNDLGRRQARRNGQIAADAVADIGAFDFVASPLSRTRETMEIAREAMGLPRDGYLLDKRLLEITFGEWEGNTTSQMRQSDPDAMNAREADKWRFAPPGGESYAQMETRITPWLAEVKRPTVVVAHGGVGRILRVLLIGEDPQVAVATHIHQDKVFVWQDGEARLI